MLIKENPNLKKEIEKILNHEWVKIHTPKTESIIFLKQLRQKGYGIFLLSNISKEAYEYCKCTYNFMDLVAGGIYSYQINCCKPEEKMYQYY